MSSLFTIKRNDTWPPIEAILQQADGTPADLRNSTVRLLLRAADMPTAFVIPAVIMNALTGEVRANLNTTHTSVVRQYRAEFEVTYVQGTVATFPTKGYFIVNILEDLG